MIEKIISGGQTGVDITAIHFAMDMSIDWGGSIPKGRRNEIGTIPSKYDRFTESSHSDYRFRTVKNIEDSDGTLIISLQRPLQGGTGFTAEEAIQHRKPIHVVYGEVFRYWRTPTGQKIDEYRVNEFQIYSTVNWVREYDIKTLNIAGPRASKAPGIESTVEYFLLELWAKLLEIDITNEIK